MASCMSQTEMHVGMYSELVIHCISLSNWVITNSTSSIILYTSSNHSPILEGTHYVYKHMHIVIGQIYLDTLRCMQ